MKQTMEMTDISFWNDYANHDSDRKCSWKKKSKVRESIVCPDESSSSDIDYPQVGILSDDDFFQRDEKIGCISDEESNRSSQYNRRRSVSYDNDFLHVPITRDVLPRSPSPIRSSLSRLERYDSDYDEDRYYTTSIINDDKVNRSVTPEQRPQQASLHNIHKQPLNSSSHHQQFDDNDSYDHSAQLPMDLREKCHETLRKLTFSMRQSDETRNLVKRQRLLGPTLEEGGENRNCSTTFFNSNRCQQIELSRKLLRQVLEQDVVMK